MKTILVPTDLSEYSDVAIAYAAELAQRLDATLYLLHVVQIPAIGTGEMGNAHATALAQFAHRDAQISLEALATKLRDRVKVAPVRIDFGDAREVIDQVAAHLGADVIVMGTHGRRGLSRWFIGSVAESVVRTAPCPVLTVHRDAAQRRRSSSRTPVSSSTFTGLVK